MIEIAKLRAKRKRQRAAQSKTLALHYGDSRTPLAHVVPDDKWPNMWRVIWPDGSKSDIVNLPRAKDAAQSIASRTIPSHNHAMLRWAYGEEPLRRPYTQNSAPDYTEVAAWLD